jgi:hypothetical protein
MSGLVVGLLDSGADPAVAPADCPRRSFGVDGHGTVSHCDDGAPDAIGHGTALARIVHADNPTARLAVARIFTDSFACTPAAAAAGLDWLVEQGARVITMSFGLREDRVVLRKACERAASAGVILLGAAPARGPGVYPSSYDGVIRISGDARTRPGEISVLGGKQADFGACPRPVEADRTEGGASFAVAHATAIALPFLAGNPGAGAVDLCDYLVSIARFHGPERRTADATPEGDSPCRP